MSNPPLLWVPVDMDTQSGEVLFNGYELWNGARLVARNSDLMFLQENARLYSENAINRHQAMFSEMALITTGWHWADRPDVMAVKTKSFAKSLTARR